MNAVLYGLLMFIVGWNTGLAFLRIARNKAMKSAFSEEFSHDDLLQIRDALRSELEEVERQIRKESI